MNPIEGRSSYELGSLDPSSCPDNPIDLLVAWLNEAAETGAPEPNAMALATVARDGRPSNRFVLLRGITDEGLAFYTNYSSRKGRELLANPWAAATFWWGILERQVRIEGSVQRLSDEESDRYFGSRPLESRLASIASPQSEVVPDREYLDELLRIATRESGDNPKRPRTWGGFRIIPDTIEFWQGRPARFHDRVLYQRAERDWVRSRLAP